MSLLFNSSRANFISFHQHSFASNLPLSVAVINTRILKLPLLFDQESTTLFKYISLHQNTTNVLYSTLKEVHIVSPRPAFAISTIPCSTISGVRSKSVARRRAPTAMLQSEHPVASSVCRRSAFPDCVSSAIVRALKKTTSAFHCSDGSTASISETADAPC